jgi:hypothetical protein
MDNRRQHEIDPTARAATSRPALLHGGRLSSVAIPLDTWSSLRHAQFRALWQSGSVYFIANAMQTMAAAWMMVQLTGSSFLAALVQTAVFLPMFLLSLPAGVLADITDRRRLIIAALAAQAAAGTLLAVLLFSGVGGPAGMANRRWRCCLHGARTPDY